MGTGAFARPAEQSEAHGRHRPRPQERVCHRFTLTSTDRAVKGLYLRKRRFRFLLLKDPFAVDNRSNRNCLVLKPVDDAVAVGHQLTDVLIVEFRDFAPRMWKSLRGFSSDLRSSLPQCLRTSESLRQCSRRCFRDLGERAETNLLGEPFAEAGFHFFLRERPVARRVFEAAAHLV